MIVYMLHLFKAMHNYCAIKLDLNRSNAHSNVDTVKLDSPNAHIGCSVWTDLQISNYIDLLKTFQVRLIHVKYASLVVV